MEETQNQQPPNSHLFRVRLWMEELGEDQAEFRGKVRHVVSGEVYYFRDWSTLQAFLSEKLKELEQQRR